jgi:hypothetical protein
MPAPKSLRIEGNATLTTTASSVTTKNPRTAAASAVDGSAGCGASVRPVSGEAAVGSAVAVGMGPS